jgi:hypothetical protein
MGPTQITTDRDSVTLRWAPRAARGTTAEGTVCDPAGCRMLAPGMQLPTLTLRVAVGVTTVSIWLRDAAGNADPARATTWTITRTAPAPRPRVDPGLRIVSATASRDRRSVTVGGTLAIPHTNRVSVSVRARIGGRIRTVRAIAITSGNGFSTVLRLPSARWSSATVVARVAGSSRYLTVEKRKVIREGR